MKTKSIILYSIVILVFLCLTVGNGVILKYLFNNTNNLSVNKPTTISSQQAENTNIPEETEDIEQEVSNQVFTENPEYAISYDDYLSIDLPENWGLSVENGSMEIKPKISVIKTLKIDNPYGGSVIFSLNPAFGGESITPVIFQDYPVDLENYPEFDEKFYMLTIEQFIKTFDPVYCFSQNNKVLCDYSNYHYVEYNTNRYIFKDISTIYSAVAYIDLNNNNYVLLNTPDFNINDDTYSSFWSGSWTYNSFKELVGILKTIEFKVPGYLEQAIE